MACGAVGAVVALRVQRTLLGGDALRDAARERQARVGAARIVVVAARGHAGRALAAPVAPVADRARVDGGVAGTQAADAHVVERVRRALEGEGEGDDPVGSRLRGGRHLRAAAQRELMAANASQRRRMSQWSESSGRWGASAESARASGVSGDGDGAGGERIAQAPSGPTPG